MRIFILTSLLLLTFVSVKAQDNINDLLAAGINDAKRFTQNYIGPASEGLAYGVNNGWFNKAKVPKRFHFELSVIGNIGFINDEKKSFQINVSEYENIRFEDGSSSKIVATALGNNDPDVNVVVTYDDPIFGSQETTLQLPTGIGARNINIIPTGFLHASFTPFEGTQLKGRFFPKVEVEKSKMSLFGFGIQQEFTSWLPADNLLPVAISGLIAYTQLDASYDFIDSKVVDGENQRIKTNVSTLLFELIVGTKLKVINFYGGLGYIYGTSETDLLGTFIVSDGVLSSQPIHDPFSVEHDISGVRGTVGANLKLGLFGLNFDYTLAEFDSASLGFNFSF